MRYIHELAEWPAFFWDENSLLTLLARARYRQGRLLGHMETLGFSSCLAANLENLTLDGVFARVSFWDKHAKTTLNDRQRLMLNKLLDKFEGKLTSSKWAKMTKSSQDTAIRDITDLIVRGILIKDEARGRSTSYSLIAC